MIKRAFAAACVVAALAASHAPRAQTSRTAVEIGDLTIETPWLRATPKEAKVVGGYMKITNNGKDADRLVGGSIEGAGRFEVHEMSMTMNVMKMRHLPDGLEIKPGQAVELMPGGYHVMGLDVSRSYTERETIKGTLVFQKAGAVTVDFAVRSMGAQSEKTQHQH
jgi:periplasmic copper chaperone A